MIASRHIPSPGTAEAARMDALRPSLPADVRFALVVAPPPAKPFAYATLADLARSLQIRRAGRPIQLIDQAGAIAGHDRPLPGVSVWIIDADGARIDSLGWAYLKGAGRQQLQAVLRAAEGA